MKELSVEEKAKRYDEAIEIARQIHDADRVSGIELTTCEEIFPELCESEDERIRKELITIIRCAGDDSSHIYMSQKDSERYVAWLEKQGEITKEWAEMKFNNIQKELQEMVALKQKTEQGEQKPAYKVEPKFRVGDWVVYCGKTCKITGLHNGIFTITNQDGSYFFNQVESTTEPVFHLWTIQDAKDGDVLCCESGWTCIFKALDNHTNTFSSYCFMDKDKWFCNTGSECHTLDKAFIKAYNGEIHPASKKQRDLLFSKMKESGYEWDAEKKEMKKIEQKPAEYLDINAIKEELEKAVKIYKPSGDFGWGTLYNVATHFVEWEKKEIAKENMLLPFKEYDNLMDSINRQKKEGYEAGYKQGKKDAQQWSKEDERILYNIIQYVSYAKGRIGVTESCLTEAQDWLKSLKDRVQQQQEWSEEDEESILEICNYLDRIVREDEDNQATQLCVKELKDWLKSLRPQYTWKPSYEQMDVLLSEVSAWTKGCPKQIVLESLYNDLKELRDEK